MTSPHETETNDMKHQESQPKPENVPSQEASGDRRLSSCSPSSDSTVGKTFKMLGFGGPRLVARVKSEGLVLWSVSQAKGEMDEVTHGWSGCAPGRLYFMENDNVEATRGLK